MPKQLHFRLVGKRDLSLVISLVAGFVLALVVPRRFDRSWVRLWSGLVVAAQRHRVRLCAERIFKILPSVTTFEQALQVAEDFHRLRAEQWWGKIRGLRWMGWQPSIEIKGLEQLNAALAAGHGVILWRMSFWGNAVFLQALSRLGLKVTHLSRQNHGAPDRSRLGLRVGATLYRRCEAPYWSERIEIPRDGSVGYVRLLVSKLRQGNCLSIVGEYRGRRSITASLFGRDIELAPGAPALAWRSGATLMTAHIERLNIFRYRVVIEKPLETERSATRRRFVEESVAEFVRRLERQLGQRPAEWWGWDYATVRRALYDDTAAFLPKKATQ